MTKEELKDTICWKCEWKSYRLKYDQCPYIRSFHDGECKEFRKSKYWEKKDDEEERAKRLGVLLDENGIVPKYKIGQEVFLYDSIRVVERTEIRRIEVSKDGKDYWYKVKGHTEYTYKEKDVYETEAECVQFAIEKFLDATRAKANRLKEMATNCGLSLNEIKGLLN